MFAGPARAAVMSPRRWWTTAEHLVDGTAPALAADLARDRYALGADKSFADLFSLSSGSKRVVDATGLLTTAAANTPAWDWSTGRRRLLLEPRPATNLVVAEDLTASGWSSGGAVATANAGTLLGRPAGRLCQSTSNVYQSRFIQTTASPSTTYTRSVYLKADGHRWVYLQQFDGVTNLGAFFDLQTGVVGTVYAGMSAKIEATAAPGVYRCSVTNTTAASANKERLQISLATVNGGAATYAGDGVSGVLVMGPQLEAGAVATSYIPTTGAAATRIADDLRLSPAALALLGGSAATIALRGRAAAIGTSAPILLGSDAEIRLAEITSTGLLASGNGSASLTATTGGGAVTADFGAAIARAATGRKAALTGGTVVADAAGWGATPTALHLGATPTTAVGPLWLDAVEIWQTGASDAALRSQARIWS